MSISDITPADIILASASPRRVELLQQLGVSFIQQVADIDETPLENELPEDFVTRLSYEKALKVYDLSNKQRPVLGSDTIVVIDGQILGKPDDYAHASNMLNRLSGRQHQVMTAVSLVANSYSETKLNISDVSFMELDQALIDAYWNSGEPEGKAGAYAIQGIAGQFIKQICGSYSAIMGLPLYETRVLLETAEIPVFGKP